MSKSMHRAHDPAVDAVSPARWRKRRYWSGITAKRQEQLLHSTSWDVLVILDACRFDHFKLLYTDYLPGDVERAVTPANPRNSYTTSDWLNRVFPDEYDATYISGTPRVNSHVELEGFLGSEHFSEVVDVWETDWDDTYGTVLPGAVTDAALESDGRRVVHYLQPHEPFISYGPPSNTRARRARERRTWRWRLRTAAGAFLLRTLGHRRTWQLMRTLGIPPHNHIQEVVEQSGVETLKRVYRENLEMVLAEVRRLVEAVDGTVAVTADHGEYLGEDGYFGHSYVPPGEAVLHVPWLEISDTGTGRE